MEPPLTEELEMLRRSVAELVEREVKPNVLQWERDGEVPRSLFTTLADLGYLGVRLSTEYGGGGQDFWFTVVLLQELMRSGSIGVAVAIMAHAEFATKVIDRGGSAWVTGTYDPVLNTLYWGIGNPSPDFNGEVRPGDNLYTCGIVALNPRPGNPGTD